MNLGRPIPRLNCIDEAENLYSVETVTMLPGTGWQAIYSEADPVSFDAVGNCFVQLKVREGQPNGGSVSSVAHSTPLSPDIDWTTKTGLIRVLMYVEDEEGNLRPGGKGSTHVEDSDDVDLGGDDD